MATASNAPRTLVVAKATAPAAAPTRKPTATDSTVRSCSRTCVEFADRRGPVPAAGEAPPGDDQLGHGDAELGHVAGHHVGLRDAFHQEPHQHALRAHGAGRDQAGDDAVPVAGILDRRAEQQHGGEDRQQRCFQRQHQRQRGAAGRTRKPDQRRGDGGGDNKRDDGEEFSGDAVIVGDEFGAGDDEAAGDLGGEQAEQRQISVAVDIAGDEAQQHRHGFGQRRFALRGDVGHGLLHTPSFRIDA